MRIPWEEPALDILNDLRSIDPANIPSLRQQTTIQKAAQAYITYRNSMGLAILKDVSGSKGFAEENESKHKNLLIRAKQDITRTSGITGLKNYADSLRALFDYQAVKTQGLKKGQFLDLFMRHIRDVFWAFPIDKQYQVKVTEKIDFSGWPIDSSLVKNQW